MAYPKICELEPIEKNVRYEEGHLAQTCGERRSNLSVCRPPLDLDGACTVELRRKRASMGDVQMHNTLGNSIVLLIEVFFVVC